MIRMVFVTALAVLAGADTLRVEKTDRVGRKIENEYLVADLSRRIIRGEEEDSGTLRALTYKPFGVTLLRRENRMHWAPNLTRAGAQGYKGLGTWHPVQEIREEHRAGEYVHYREGYMADYLELKIEAEYRFLPGVPYFLFWSRLTVEEPFEARLVRNNQMTMDDFFTHLAWPGRGGTPHVVTFDQRHALLEAEPIAFDAPWLAFLNLQKGYGYGFVMLECEATRTANAGISISDGAGNGKYWYRRLISGRAETALAVGDQFVERTAYVLFRCSTDSPLDEFILREKEIRQRFRSAAE